MNRHVPLGLQVVAETLVETAAIDVRSRVHVGRNPEDLVEQRGHGGKANRAALGVFATNTAITLGAECATA
jgi:hypothetical protein